MRWKAYEISPIDTGWRNLKTVWETARTFGADRADERARGEPDQGLELPTLDDFLNSWESAKQAASHAGWEGDFRNDPVVFWIPNDTEFSYGFVIKQDNNGTTYVVSPVHLEHIAELVQ